MEKLTNCPVCLHNSLENSKEVLDHFGNGELFHLDLCTHCQTLITNPRPTQKDIGAYYQTNSYVSHGESKGKLFDAIYSNVQKSNLRYKKKLIEKYTEAKSLLDYGCGAGAFLTYMKKQGYHVQGVEPDTTARHLASAKLTVHPDLTNIRSETFDVITLYHVLEHVHQLDELMNNLKRMLHTKGTLHIALPNYRSADAQHYQNHWAGYDVPRHLYHLNQKGVQALAKRNELKISAIYPLKFDSYYVSLLSEQYKKSRFAPIKAFWHGYRSNLKAKSTGEFSSLIYILNH